MNSPALDPHRPADPAASRTPQPVLPAELLNTWQAWRYQNTLTHQIRHARAAGNTTNEVNALIHALRAVAVEPLDALRANHQLARLLITWQPDAIRAARKTGATWQQIATAIDTTAEQACANYLAHHEHLPHTTATNTTNTSPDQQK